MIRKAIAFILLAGLVRLAAYAQENQNQTIINAALHGWEYEIKAGISLGGPAR